jgi:hypothetical protein
MCEDCGPADTCQEHGKVSLRGPVAPPPYHSHARPKQDDNKAKAGVRPWTETTGRELPTVAASLLLGARRLVLITPRPCLQR